MKKRLLSIVLSLCMVLALMPQMVFAESSGDFSYTVSDGKVTITGYSGSGGAVVIPGTINDNPVTAIGNATFKEKNIESVTIPSSVTSIGYSAFYNCYSLSSVTFGKESQLTSIGVEAFQNCTSLASITIPSGVTSIEEQVFFGCTKLASIDIPDGVNTIGIRAFSNCSSLKNVTFGKDSQLTSIGNSAFSPCTSLKSIEIPSSVTSIGDKVFYNCTSLESIFLPKDLEVTDAAIPETASQVKYSLDSDKGEVTITEITLRKDRASVDIPETICGYPVVREEEKITLTVPFTTTVEVSGNASPGKTTFNLEVVNSQGNELQPNDYNVKITASVETDGAGDYNGNLTFTGTASAILRMFDNERDEYGYIYVKQAGVNDSNWDVDEAAWGLFHRSVVDLSDEEVEPSPIYIFPAVKDGTSYSVEYGENGVDKMTFVNKYANSAVDPSDSDGTTNGDAEDSVKTGDNTNLALWLVLMLLSGAGITGTTLYTRRKRTNE